MRSAFIAFTECEVRGNWTWTTDVGRVSREFTAVADDGEVWLVRQDGLRRNLAFKKDSVVSITPMMLRFESDDVVDEHTVDEDEKAGKQPRTKLKFT